MMNLAAKQVFIRRTLEASLDLDGLAEEVKAVQPSFEVTNINKWQGVKIAFASYYPAGTRLIPAKITDTLQGLPSYFTVPFYNHDILEKAEEHGLSTGKNEDAYAFFIEWYWKALGNELYELFECQN